MRITNDSAETFSEEHLTLVAETTNTLVYAAQSSDFAVATVVMDRANFGDLAIPRRIVVTVSFDKMAAS